MPVYREAGEGEVREGKVGGGCITQRQRGLDTIDMNMGNIWCNDVTVIIRGGTGGLYSRQLE
jgi:hypothetical protein